MFCMKSYWASHAQEKLVSATQRTVVLRHFTELEFVRIFIQSNSNAKCLGKAFARAPY